MGLRLSKMCLLGLMNEPICAVYGWFLFLFMSSRLHRCKSDVVDAHLIIQTIFELEAAGFCTLGLKSSSHQLHASKKSTENDSSSWSEIAVRVSASHDAFIDLSFDALIVK